MDANLIAQARRDLWLMNYLVCAHTEPHHAWGLACDDGPDGDLTAEADAFYAGVELEVTDHSVAVPDGHFLEGEFDRGCAGDFSPALISVHDAMRRPATEEAAFEASGGPGTLAAHYLLRMTRSQAYVYAELQHEIFGGSQVCQLVWFPASAGGHAHARIARARMDAANALLQAA